MSLGTKIGDTSFATNKSSIALNGSSNSSSLKRKRPPMIKTPNVLTEIPVDCLKLRLNSAGDCPDDGVICSSGFGVGLYSVKGKKKTMEDAHTFVSCPIAKKRSYTVTLTTCWRNYQRIETKKRLSEFLKKFRNVLQPALWTTTSHKIWENLLERFLFI